MINNMKEWEKEFDYLIKAGEQLGEFEVGICEHERDCIKAFIQAQIDKAREECARNIFVDIGKRFTCNDMVSDYNSGRSDAFKQVMQIKAKYIKE